MAPTGSYRKGVKVGDNYVEQMAAESPQAQGSGKFEAASTSAEAFSAQGKTGAALAAASRRQDILTAFKYSGSRASSSDEPACYATTSQLAFPPVAGRGSGAPEHPRRVQDCLWAGSKFVDARVPRSVSQRTRGAARQHRLEEEQGRSPFQTVEKEQLDLAANSPARAAARPPQARPHAEGGQAAQVGRKATGEFRAHCDKDYLRIGLRK